MINVDVVQAENNIFLIRFSEPDEIFIHKNYIPVSGQDEVLRRLYFKNRKYIMDTLGSWLNQRKHAAHFNHDQVTTLIYCLSNLKDASIFALCKYISVNRKKFEMIAPPENSRCRIFYEKKIIPILDFIPCDKISLKQYFNGNKTSGFVDTEG